MKKVEKMDKTKVFWGVNKQIVSRRVSQKNVEEEKLKGKKKADGEKTKVEDDKKTGLNRETKRFRFNHSVTDNVFNHALAIPKTEYVQCDVR